MPVVQPLWSAEDRRIYICPLCGQQVRAYIHSVYASCRDCRSDPMMRLLGAYSFITPDEHKRRSKEEMR